MHDRPQEARTPIRTGNPQAAGQILPNERVSLPGERLGEMADAVLAQSAIDRLQSAAYEPVLDGDSYRQREKPGLDIATTTPRP